jgi:hypothetical protein
VSSTEYDGYFGEQRPEPEMTPTTKSTDAGKTRLAGIEPARDDAQNDGRSRNFTYEAQLCGLGIEVARFGKHVNLTIFDSGIESGISAGFEVFEPLETAIPKLEALLRAAKLAQGDLGERRSDGTLRPAHERWPDGAPT